MRLLIVDDERITRNVLLNHIPWSEIGITKIETAGDGKEALEIAKGFKPNIVLSDIRMPKMNGLELARCLKAEQEDCRIIFLSAYSDREYLKEAIQLRAVSYVEKPIKPDEIKEVVKSAVDEIKKQQRLENRNYYAKQKKICMEILTGEKVSADIEEYPFLRGLEYIASELRLYPQDPSAEVEYDENALSLVLEELIASLLKSRVPDINDSDDAMFRKYCLFTVKDLNHIVVLFNIDNDLQKDKVYSLTEKLRKGLLHKLPQLRRVFAGVGLSVRDVKELKDSAIQAKAARRKCFLGGVIKDAKEQGMGRYDFSGKLPIEILNLWRYGNYDELENSLSTLADEISRFTETTVDSVRGYYLTLLLTLTQRAKSQDSVDFGDISAAALSALGEACCLEEMGECLKDTAKLYFNNKDSKSQYSQLSDKVAKYILDHYSDERLSISQIAGKMYLSPNYLSLLFKKDTGKTINQFITEVRIEKAKALLKKDRTPLSSIAEKIGYHDANYFSKAFKKETGVTPKAYRESI